MSRSRSRAICHVTIPHWWIAGGMARIRYIFHSTCSIHGHFQESSLMEQLHVSEIGKSLVESVKIGGSNEDDHERLEDKSRSLRVELDKIGSNQSCS